MQDRHMRISAADIDTFFTSAWEVHYNSSRTGIRLLGPKPQWARKDGGEAGLHPSNIHDNGYAFGTVDFTGDMPVILTDKDFMPILKCSKRMQLDFNTPKRNLPKELRDSLKGHKFYVHKKNVVR